MSMPSDADIDLFVRLMRQKLEKNSHKETVTVDTLPRIMAKLLREGAEFLEQLEDDDHDPNSLYECADIANFALLAFCALRSAGVLTYEEMPGEPAPVKPEGYVRRV